jgi:hypothetical protein
MPYVHTALRKCGVALFIALPVEIHVWRLATQTLFRVSSLPSFVRCVSDDETMMATARLFLR